VNDVLLYIYQLTKL